jgi:hypothetical protein
VGQFQVDFEAGGILNPVGVVGGSVLGILYWLEHQAKASSTSALKEVQSSSCTLNPHGNPLCLCFPGHLETHRHIYSRSLERIMNV